MKIMKKIFISVLLVFVASGTSSLVTASGTDLRKTYTWKYDIDKDAKVALDNYDCNVIIHTWDKGETEFRLTINASSGREEDLNILNEYLQDLSFMNTSSSVIFHNRFWKSRNGGNNRIRMELKGGEDITLTDFDMRGELWIPSRCRLELDSKYSEISLDAFSGTLALDLYNDNLYGSDVNGNIDLVDKYSTIEFKDIKDLHANIYSTKLTAENAGKLDIDSKYSKVTMLSSADIEVNGYSDKYNIRKTGNIIFVSKYTDLTTESSGLADINSYEGTFSLDEVMDIKIISKYADFQFERAGNCTINSSYSDKITAGSLTSLDIDHSKYCTFSVNVLLRSLTEADGYSDKFIIMEAGPELQEFRINGKYLNASLSIPETVEYRFRANITYPKLEINESAFKPKVKVFEGSKLEYDAVKGKEREGMPLIEANGYQVTLKITEI